MPKGFGTCRKLSFLITCLAFVMGAVILKQAWDEFNRFKDSVPSVCMVVGFFADEELNITCSHCRFIIQYLVPDSTRRMIVQGWTPEFHTTYRDQVTVKPKHKGFSCCPTTGNFDCCKFLDEVSDNFCDNWSEKDPLCPSPPWPCFVDNFESYKTSMSEFIPPEALFEGDCRGWILHSGVGGGLALFALTAFACQFAFVRHRWSTRVRKVHKSVMSCFYFIRAHVLIQIDRIINRGKGKGRVVSFANNDSGMIRSPRTLRATIKLQAWFRGCIVRHSFIGQNVRRIRRKTRTSLAQEAANRRAQLADEPVVTPPGVDLQPFLLPLPDSQNQFKKYLYDTGSSHSFRRCTRVRHLSLPGDPIEKLEVLLLPGDGPMGAHMSFAEEDDDDPRMIVESVVTGSFAHIHGIRPGHRLARVGALEGDGDFACSAEELLWALKKERRKPLHIIFESSRWGMPDENCNLRAAAFALKASNAARKGGSRSNAPAPPEVHPFATPRPPTAQPPSLVPKLAGGPFPPQVQAGTPQPPASRPPMLNSQRR